jgi:hypothetical protein
VKLLKKMFINHVDKCPLPDFGTDISKPTFQNDQIVAFERTLGLEYKNLVKKKETEIQQL